MFNAHMNSNMHAQICTHVYTHNTTQSYLIPKGKEISEDIFLVDEHCNN